VHGAAAGDHEHVADALPSDELKDVI
jgi:hypothetical protein